MTGVDNDYDEAMLDIRHTETQLQEYLEKQKQGLGCKVCTHYCIGFAGTLYRLTYNLFIGYPENAKYPPDNNCISCSRHKIVWKLAYLGVEITLLILKHKIVRKVSFFGV